MAIVNCYHPEMIISPLNQWRKNHCISIRLNTWCQVREARYGTNSDTCSTTHISCSCDDDRNLLYACSDRTLLHCLLYFSVFWIVNLFFCFVSSCVAGLSYHWWLFVLLLFESFCMFANCINS